MRVDIEQLRASARTFTPLCGIYFLFDGDELVYIGQSRDIHGRMRQHFLQEEKQFDRWNFIEVPSTRLLQEESILIRRYKPRLNIAGLLPPGQWRKKPQEKPTKTLRIRNIRNADKIKFAKEDFSIADLESLL